MKTTARAPYVSARFLLLLLFLLLTCAAPILGLPSSCALSSRPQPPQPPGDRDKEQVNQLISSITSDFEDKLDASADEPCEDGGPISCTCRPDTIVYRRE
jgi:hypothetical protein